jgi:type II secretory pathway pseudopilin PulG
MLSKHRTMAPREGFSFMELQVAFLLLAIALAGLGPLVVMQSRQLRKLESRLDAQTTYYLVPSEYEWARKLGVPASIETEDPGPASSPPVTLIDDGDPGYSETDEAPVDWATELRSNAFHGDTRRNDLGGAGDKATWEFTGLAPGWYEVWVTFSAEGHQASDACYTVYDGVAFEGTVLVDQGKAPSGAAFEGAPWESLGLFSIVSGTLRAELRAGAATGDVLADAVRIVPVRNVVQVTSQEKWLTSEEVTAHVSVTVLTP